MIRLIFSFVAAALVSASLAHADPAPSPSPSPSPVPPYSTTNSKGKTIATFTSVTGPGTFGVSWKDPSGTVWSQNLGNYANNALKPDQDGKIIDSPATEACVAAGGRLPSKDDYTRFNTYFEHASTGYLTDQGMTDLSKLFPDMNAAWYWTSSVYPALVDDAYAFYSPFGEITYFDANSREIAGSIRCVSP